MSNNGNKPGAGCSTGAYAGLVGLGDTDRLDSSLYDEQVDFDFFETGSGDVQEEMQNPTRHDSPVNSSGLTVTVDPPTPVPDPKNNLLLQLAPSQTPGSASTSSSADASDNNPPFSTQLLMAALQDANPENNQPDSPQSQDQDKELPQQQQLVRVHLFDLTDSDDEDDDADELELAEINGQAQAVAACGDGELHSWEAHDFYHHQHLQQQHQRQKKKQRVHAAALEPAGVLGRRSGSDDDQLNDQSSDDDEEGYYLSDSERSDITDVTPMSSVACSPMPPFAGGHVAPSESDDSFDGYPINREGAEEGLEECDGLEDELGRITPSEDDDDIDEILRILPNSATGQHFEIPAEGDVDPFMKMYRDGPNSPALDGDEEDRKRDYSNQYTMNSVSAGLDRHYYSASPEIDAATEAGGKNSGVGNRAAGALAGGNGNNLLTVNYGNTSKSYVDAQRRRMLAAAHAHHTARHHGLANGGGPKLNKVHHPAHGHHHHHNHHGPGSYFYGTGHGGHHFNHHHAHHHNNYHQQYHNLTMALQRKRQNQQKQIEHDNSILKRKLQNVKPSVDILKAFGPTSIGAGPGTVITSSSTSSSSAGGTPAPNNNKKKGGALAMPSSGGVGYASSTASSVCGGSSTTTSSSSSVIASSGSGSDKN